MRFLPAYESAMPLQNSTSLSYYFYNGDQDSASYDSVTRQVWCLVKMLITSLIFNVCYQACVCDSAWSVGLRSGQTQLAEYFGPGCEFRYLIKVKL